MLPLQELEREQPRALSRVLALANRGIERDAEVFRPLDRQCELRVACFGKQARERACAGVVEADHRGEIETRGRNTRVDRAAKTQQLSGVRAGQLAGDRQEATLLAVDRCAGPYDTLVPCGRRTLELHDVLHRKLIESAPVVRALEQVEQRQPRERRELRIVVVDDAVLEQRARGIGLPAREQKRRVFEHRAKAGVGLRHFDGRIGGRPIDDAVTRSRNAARRLGERPCRNSFAIRRLVRELARRRAARRGGRSRRGRSVGFLRKRLVEKGHRQASRRVARRDRDYRPIRLPSQATLSAQNSLVEHPQHRKAAMRRRKRVRKACRMPHRVLRFRRWRDFPRRIPSSATCRLQLRHSRHGGSGSRGNTRAPTHRLSKAAFALW